MSSSANGPSAASSPCVPPRNDSAASSSPSITSGSAPVVVRTIATNASRFVASRTAAVAPTRIRTGAQGARPRAVSREHRCRPRERRRIEESGRVDALAELRDEHVAGELGGQVARRGRFLDDQQPAGVRPLIDRGDPRALSRMHRLDPLGDPSPDDVVAAGEVVRVVGVQALDPAARAADPTPGLRRRQHRAAVSGRFGVRRVDRRAEAGIVVVPAVQLGDRAGGLQPGDGFRRGRGR